LKAAAGRQRTREVGICIREAGAARSIQGKIKTRQDQNKARSKQGKIKTRQDQNKARSKQGRTP
jgi:hypothetical protein